MGADSSKPSSEVQQHVFSTDHPVRFSNQLVDSIQKNTFTNTARSKQQELQFQERLAAELEKLRDREAQIFNKFSETLSDEEPQSNDPTIMDKISDTTSSKSDLAEKQRQQEMSNASVRKEVEQLRAKLDKRRKLEQVNGDLGEAKEALIACFRKNERRPLDCWEEVETFKKEVGRLERDFVERTIR